MCVRGGAGGGGGGDQSQMCIGADKDGACNIYSSADAEYKEIYKDIHGNK